MVKLKKNKRMDWGDESEVNCSAWLTILQGTKEEH